LNARLGFALLKINLKKYSLKLNHNFTNPVYPEQTAHFFTAINAKTEKTNSSS
jgi:hypothetical protein